MVTTSVVRTSFYLVHPYLDAQDAAFTAQLTKANEVLEEFKTAHGVVGDNLVSQSEGEQRTTIRSWPSVEIAQAWVDCVLAGNLTQGLEYPPEILSAQVIVE